MAPQLPPPGPPPGPPLGPPPFDHVLLSVHTKLNVFTAGIYVWEYIQSSEVERALIQRRISFRWPLIPYFVGRLAFLVTVISCLVTEMEPYGERDCSVSVGFISIAAALSMGCASTNLMIRAWLIWKGSNIMLALLAVLAAGHWAMLIIVVQMLDRCATNQESLMQCPVRPIITLTFAYSIIFDVVVFVLTIIGLRRKSSTADLSRMLRTQGLVYCFIVVVANAVSLVFSCLNLSGPLSLFFIIPTICASVIASSRAVQALLSAPPHTDGSKRGSGSFTFHISLPSNSIPMTLISESQHHLSS